MSNVLVSNPAVPPPSLLTMQHRCFNMCRRASWYPTMHCTGVKFRFNGWTVVNSQTMYLYKRKAAVGIFVPLGPRKSQKSKWAVIQCTVVKIGIPFQNLALWSPIYLYFKFGFFWIKYISSLKKNLQFKEL